MKCFLWVSAVMVLCIRHAGRQAVTLSQRICSRSRLRTHNIPHDCVPHLQVHKEQSDCGDHVLSFSGPLLWLAAQAPHHHLVLPVLCRICEVCAVQPCAGRGQGQGSAEAGTMQGKGSRRGQGAQGRGRHGQAWHHGTDGGLCVEFAGLSGMLPRHCAAALSGPSLAAPRHLLPLILRSSLQFCVDTQEGSVHVSVWAVRMDPHDPHGAYCSCTTVLLRPPAERLLKEAPLHA
jgi:hypothetical protein